MVGKYTQLPDAYLSVIEALHHFFRLRLCRRAQWEIREMARLMLADCRAAAPVIFRRAGPSCLFGPCTEARPCGRPYKDMEDLLAIEKD